MIYTIGHKENYLKAISESRGTILKTGRIPPGGSFPDGYPGGYAFLNQEDAQRRINEAYPDSGYAVFGLKAEWGVDTMPDVDGGWWHNLLRDASIVVLDEMQ